MSSAPVFEVERTPARPGPGTVPLAFLRALGGIDLAGADVVEVSPPYDGPGQQTALATESQFQAVPHPADRSLLLLTRLAVHSQARISGSVTGPHGTVVPIIGNGSRFGGLLKPGVFQLVQSYRRKPGSMPVRLRLKMRTLPRGAYSLRVVAVDPWGRRSRLTLRFRYPS